MKDQLCDMSASEVLQLRMIADRGTLNSGEIPWKCYQSLFKPKVGTLLQGTRVKCLCPALLFLAWLYQNYFDYCLDPSNFERELEFLLASGYDWEKREGLQRIKLLCYKVEIS